MARLLSHDGVELEYEAGGDGAAVLLTHGYGATGRMWDAQRAALDGYRLITWDMRGHGRTQSPADPARYSIEATVADMRALLLHLGATRAVIGGLSLGGYASLAFYGSHPEMVRALVVCDSGPGYRNPAAREAWNARAQERARELEAGGLRSGERLKPRHSQNSYAVLCFEENILDLGIDRSELDAIADVT